MQENIASTPDVAVTARRAKLPMWRRLRAPMRRDRLSAGIILFALLIITGMWAVIEAKIVRDRDARIAEVMRENANLARAFEEHTVRTLDYIDATLLALKERYEALGSTFDLPVFYRQIRPNPALLRNAALTDAAGQIILTTLPSQRVSIADREHFKVHLSGPGNGQIYIGQPVIARVSGKWSIIASRRANTADGTFAGAVTVAVAPEYFSNFYRDVYRGTGNVVTLVGTDGIVRARLAADSADLGQDISGGSAFKRMMASSVEPSAAAVTYIGSSAVDGIERVYAARRIHGYPLLVFVGAPVSEVLASVAMQARNYRFAASGSSLLIGVFALTLVSFSRRRGVAARALRSASDLLERTGALARVGGWELDVRSNALSWSKQTCRIHEVDPSFAPTLEQAIAFYAPEARPVIEAALRAGIEHGTPWDLELPLITAKGRRIWARAQGSVVFEHGEVVKLVGAFQDVTLRRESEAQLHLLETAVSRLNDIVVITEAEPISEPGPRIVFVNDAFVRLTGFSREEVIGKTPRILQRASTDRSELDRIRRAIELWQPVRAEVLNYTKGGEELWLELDIAPIADAAGWFTHWVAVERDITKRKAAEEQLRQSAERTRRLVRAAAVGLWEWNLLTDAVYFSPEWKRLLGYADDEIVNRFDEWQKRVHPEDVARAKAAVDDYRNGRVPRYSVEIRMLHRDSSWRWILSEADLGRNAKGEPVMMMGSHIDITERKRQEAELRRSNEIMMGVIENLPCGLSVVDAEFRLVAHNTEFRRLLDFPDSLFADTETRFEQILRFNAERGEYGPGDVEAILPSIIERARAPTPHQFERTRPNGIFLEVRGAAIPGGGFVTTYTDISAHKRAELALAASELFAKATVDAVTAHICVLDRTGKIVTVNQAWRDFFGKNHAQAENLNYYIGTNYLEICASASGAGPDADAAASMAKGIRSVMEGQCDEFTLEYACHSSTAQRWFVASVTRFHGDSGNILVAHEDLTARKISETALREEKDRIASIVDSAMDAIVTVDDQQRILVFNEAAEQMFGCKAEDAMGQTLDRLLPERFRRAHGDHIRDFGNSGVSKRAMGQAGIVRAMRFDGTEFPIEASISRVMVGGRTQFTVVLRDISLRTSLEAQLRESQKMEAMGTLAGGIAHDFNNIVAVILGNAGLASKEIGTADDRARLRVDEVTKAAVRARNLIDQILTFSRRQPHSMQQVGLQPLVHEALALLRATLPAAVQLHHDLAVQALVVVGNATQIEQVVLNLCTNAWQAGAREIWIRLEQRAVALADDAHALLGLPLGDYACLAVRDNGSGMDEATQARIFEPFFTSKAIGQGTGLGLSVVHGIVTQHRGAISVQSQLGAGTTFMVLLPLVLADAPVKTEAAVPAPSPVPAGRGQHIVYVDDDESILFLAKSILENSGYRVTYCLSGELALEAITEVGGAIDLLVTDYNLTGMSGLDLVRKIREQGHGMAVVITSGFVTEELLEGASRLGAVEVISKPDTMAELRGLIDRLLGESGVW